MGILGIQGPHEEFSYLGPVFSTLCRFLSFPRETLFRLLGVLVGNKTSSYDKDVLFVPRFRNF